MARPVTLLPANGPICRWRISPQGQRLRLRRAGAGLLGRPLRGRQGPGRRRLLRGQSGNCWRSTTCRCSPSAPPGRPGRAGQHRRPAPGDPAAVRLGRRRSGRRERAGRRGDEEHGPGRPEARRRASSTASPVRASGTCSTPSRRCSPAMIDDGFKLLAERLNPILDVFGECGVKFALEVHPTEIAFDLYTAERALRGAGRPRGVRLQLRPEPLDLAGRRSGRVHPRVPRPDLPRPHEGRHRDAQRPERHPGQPPELRRPAPRLGLPLAGPRRRELRGDHPRAERRPATRPAVGRVGRQRHGPRARAPRRPASSSSGSTSRPAPWPSTRRFPIDVAVRRSSDRRAVRSVGGPGLVVAPCWSARRAGGPPPRAMFPWE